MSDPSYCNACGLAGRGTVDAVYGAVLRMTERGRVVSEVQVLLCEEHMDQATMAIGVVVVRSAPIAPCPPPVPASGEVVKSRPEPKPSPRRLSGLEFGPESLAWFRANEVSVPVRTAIQSYIDGRVNLLGNWSASRSFHGSKARVRDVTLLVIVRAALAGHIALRLYCTQTPDAASAYPVLAEQGDAGLDIEDLVRNSDTAESIVVMLRKAHPHASLIASWRVNP